MQRGAGTCARAPCPAAPPTAPVHAHCAGLHGAKVVVTGRRQQVLDAACQDMQAKGIQVLGLQGDVRQQSSCQGWVAEVRALADVRGRTSAGGNAAGARAGVHSPACTVGAHTRSMPSPRARTAAPQVSKRLGRLDILVNCAAGNFLATAEGLTTNGFRTGTTSTKRIHRLRCCAPQQTPVAARRARPGAAALVPLTCPMLLRCTRSDGD